MANEDETVWAVFNGEIYNHRELRRDLEARGHRFAGSSDAEVLPHLYEEYGEGLAERLRGMFAAAVYDCRKQELLLLRDRFGIKPLFYASAAARLAFASEIRALLELREIDRTPDRQAIYDFAALFYIPAPETFYVGIRALEPGHLLRAQLGPDGVDYQIRAYHRWALAPDPTLSVSDAVDQAEPLLAAAIGRQMQSDVPLGALLSGGIDSSLVSAAAQGAIQQPLRTFNVRFAEREYDESWAALAVARHIGSEHETLDMNGRLGTWEQVTGLLLHAGQPYADTSIFATHAICRLMRRQVTVALSGDGGDEAFGGYHFFWQIARIARYQKWFPMARRAGSWMPASMRALGLISDRLLGRIGDLDGADDTAILQSLFCWMREEDHRRLCRDLDLLPVRRLFEPQWDYHLRPGSSRLERLSARTSEITVRLLLANDFLFKVDTASMREGLEVRVPMLDEDLFAFGLSLPHRLKVKGRTCKRILRAVAERKLPPRVAAKPKRGFAMPLDTWVGTDFKQQLREKLLGPSSRLPEYFRPEAYGSIIRAFCENRLYPGLSRQGIYQTAVMLLALELALERTQTRDRERYGESARSRRATERFSTEPGRIQP